MSLCWTPDPVALIQPRIYMHTMRRELGLKDTFSTLPLSIPSSALHTGQGRQKER